MECGWLGDETAVAVVMTVFLRCVVLCGFGRTFELTVFFWGGWFVWDSSLVRKLNRLDALCAGLFFFVYRWSLLKMLVLEPVTSFVPRVSHFHFHFKFNVKLGVNAFSSRSHVRLLFVSCHLTMANDERKRRRHLAFGIWHLAFDNYSWALLSVFSPFFGVWSVPQLYLVIGIHSMSCDSTHTLPLPLTGRLCEKKCREECKRDLRWRVLQC